MKTLQEKIESIAMAKLESDIKEVSDQFSNFLTSQKGLFRTGISLEIMNGEKEIYPWLSQIFECTPVKSKIIQYNIDDYIEREISKILK